jgi:large subunit ribosomal protein L18
MAKGPSYRLAFRRRREGKTDYRARRALVLSGLPRLVVRGTLNHMVVQVVKAGVSGDSVRNAADSRELTKTYGWQGDCGNVTAAYLTGYLCGLRAVNDGVKQAVLDIGLQASSRGARVFATLKGAIEAGVEVPHDKTMLPQETRIRGQHVVDYANELASSNPEEYQRRFAQYLSRGLRPEQLSEHFSVTKEKIEASFRKQRGET